jgi:hypothetical protein
MAFHVGQKTDNPTMPPPTPLAALQRRGRLAEKKAAARAGPIIEPQCRLLTARGMLSRIREERHRKAEVAAETPQGQHAPPNAVLVFLQIASCRLAAAHSSEEEE